MINFNLKEFLEDVKTSVEYVKRDLENKFDLEEQFPEGSDIGDGIRKIKKEIKKQEEKAENRRRAPENLIAQGEKKSSGFEKADHLFVRRGIYTHHAIYVGYGNVVHYNKCSDGSICIHQASLEEFAGGDDIQVMSTADSPLKYDRDEAVKRALRRMSEEKYNLLDNNCEHFVRWCRNGNELWDEM